MLWRLLLASLPLVTASGVQAPQVALHSITGGTRQKHLPTPTIDGWALNPKGDAAVIHTSTFQADGEVSNELHLLAINAQYTIPSVYHGPARPESLYTFISDDTYLTLTPSKSSLWELSAAWLNYTSLPPSFPPSIGYSYVVGELSLRGLPTKISFPVDAGVLMILEDAQQGLQGGLVLVKLAVEDNKWRLALEPALPLNQSNLLVQDFTASSSHLAFTAYNRTGTPKTNNNNLLYTIALDAAKWTPQEVTSARGPITSPVFDLTGQLAWLQVDDSGKRSGKRYLWLLKGSDVRKAQLDFELNPTAIIFSKDSPAINLLAKDDSCKTNKNPSNGTIHETIHIGTTPLYHSHLIGVKSSKTEAKELWVISHNPDDPTDNYENIRLTFFSEAPSED